jgi:DNA-binding CsgD family transcriptional regulator
MRDAFRAAYPPERSLPARIFLPAVHPRTFLRALHLGMMFPLGIAYFTVLVTAFALGGAMIWTIVGPVVLLITLYLTRWAGDAEAWVVRRVSSIPLRRPPTAIERGQSFREQVKTRLIDPTSWTGLAYLFIQFPVGIVSFVVLVTGGAVSAFLVSAPFYVGLADRVVDEPRPLSIDLLFWSTSDATMTEAMWMLPGGVLAYLLTMHLITAGSALHASWARLMLGSRAEPVAMVSPESPPSGPSPDDDSPSDQPRPDEGAPSELLAPPVEVAKPAAASELLPELVAPRLVASSEALDELTAREREVLTLIARGYSNAAIAETFVISEGTVKTHVKRVLAKLELRDRTQAAIYAYETGFVGLALSEVGATSNEPIPIVRARAR